VTKKERNMSDKTMATKDNLVGKAAPKPHAVREESVLRWPSAATSAGGAYIPSHGAVTVSEPSKEG
jgi:hypothetical protein